MTRPSFLAMGCLLMTCSCSHEKELQAVVDDISGLDTAVEATLHDSPNEQGLSKGEALVEAKSAALHARIVALRKIDGVDPGGRVAMACLKNTEAARIANDYIANATARYGGDPIPKSDSELRVRARKLSGSLCDICVTSSTEGSICAAFHDVSP